MGSWEHPGQQAYVSGLWEREGGVPGITADCSAVLPWGSGCNANELGWLMLDPDPDKWPVVAWRRQIRYGDSRWALFDCGMVGFLVKMMRAEFDVCPLGDTSLWDATAPSCTGVSSSAAGLRALIPKRASLIRTCRTFFSGPRPYQGACQPAYQPGLQRLTVWKWPSCVCTCKA